MMNDDDDDDDDDAQVQSSLLEIMGPAWRCVISSPGPSRRSTWTLWVARPPSTRGEVLRVYSTQKVRTRAYACFVYVYLFMCIFFFFGSACNTPTT